MTSYRLTDTDMVIRLDDNTSIPADLSLGDYLEFLAWKKAGGVPEPYVAPPASPQQMLSQDLMAQFTPADILAIQTAISGNVSFLTLWYSLLAQKDPMQVTNARFLIGWKALISVLGQPRMDVIAAALGVSI